jgi:hypothetical protein
MSLCPVMRLVEFDSKTTQLPSALTEGGSST